MKKTPATGSLALAAMLVLPAAAHAADVTQYSMLPAVTPNNVPSLGYQATQTKEFGDHVRLANTGTEVSSFTLGMSSWSVQASDYDMTGTVSNASGYFHDVTVNLYGVNNPNAVTPTVGGLLATVTKSVFVPWHTPNGANGTYFETTFDFSSLHVVLPTDVIFGVKFDTQTWGDNPTGINGPYNSLNVGLSQDLLPSFGSNPNADDKFWSTSTAANYTDGGLGGVGVFRQDTVWLPYTGITASINAAAPVPLPAASLSGAALMGLMGLRRRRP